MTRNPFKAGNLSEHSSAIGAVPPKMVRGRPEELATIHGDWLPKVSASDLEQGQQHLTGAPDRALPEAILESVPESERWDPVPGSPGHRIPVPSNDDEDEEGRSVNEQLVEEGVAEAEHDKEIQAARLAARADKRENRVSTPRRRR